MKGVGWVGGLSDGGEVFVALEGVFVGRRAVLADCGGVFVSYEEGGAARGEVFAAGAIFFVSRGEVFAAWERGSVAL